MVILRPMAHSGFSVRVNSSGGGSATPTLSTPQRDRNLPQPTTGHRLLSRGILMGPSSFVGFPSSGLDW